ncbi:MAG: FAD-dependent oxidoreductase [Anaerolineae bacterium]|nr:FAD-dependent oxidoreductase [Anaerolineae bacterium]
MTKVTVVGGGLAGMTAALRLLERGCEVELFDAGARLGGKAGAVQHGGDWDEHGYHIFPLWYLNSWKLIDDLGIRDHFVDCHEFHQYFGDGVTPRKVLTDFTSIRHALTNLTSGIASIWQMTLYFCAAFDLLSQPYSRRAFLDQLSVNGFLRSRFYRTEAIAHLFQSSVVGGSSAPSYEASAMTFRNVLRYWMEYPLPMSRILRGDLQQFYILPFQRRLEELGCDIRFNQSLRHIELDGGRIKRLHVEDLTTMETHLIDVDQVVIAIPAEKLALLVDDALFGADPNLGRIHNLKARPMAAFNLYLKRRIPGLPASHVNLLHSQYGLSFIDVSQVWEGYDTTVLNCIAASFVDLTSLSPERALERLVEDMMRFMPELTWEDIDRTDFQSHLREPLVMNDAGAWQFRPEARTQIENLYLAGDYCRSHVDLVTMESAVTSGLLAAEALRADAGLPDPIAVLEPKGFPQWLLSLGSILLIPVAAVARLMVWITER